MWEAPAALAEETVMRDIPIGRVVQNVQAYILDAAFQPVPIGVPGELFLGGQGIARGYVCQPDMTAQQFLPDPFSGRPGARLYKNGDRARYLADGTIEFLGRTDHQVKIRGFRVELEEIESALREHPQVRNAIVVSHRTGTQHNRLIAYADVGDESVPDQRTLQDFLRERLPEYMVPSDILCVKELPRTAGGK
jgi:acyl-coenzyme A synthetase/AMP-(fatty) acid ligase